MVCLAIIVENHYGWNWIPFLMGFGGQVFRDPPHDLMPMLDTPEAIEAADFYAGLLRDYGPNGILSDTYDEVVVDLKNGPGNYSTNNQDFLVQMGAADSKVRDTCDFSHLSGRPEGTLSRRRVACLGHSNRVEEQGRGLAVHPVGDVEADDREDGEAPGLYLDHPSFDHRDAVFQAEA